jgi:chemotaxis-related protein WspB
MSLFLQIAAGTQGFLLAVEHVTRVLPLMRIQSVPEAPPAVRGVINYHGRALPVLDLCEMVLRRPASHRLTTRLILIPTDGLTGTVPAHGGRLVALLAEKVSDVIRVPPGDFSAPAATPGAGYLGSVVNVAGVLLRKLDIAALSRTPELATLFESAA